MGMAILRLGLADCVKNTMQCTTPHNNAERAKCATMVHNHKATYTTARGIAPGSAASKMRGKAR